MKEQKQDDAIKLNLDDKFDTNSPFVANEDQKSEAKKGDLSDNSSMMF